MLESDLVQAIEQDHRALNALVTGDPEPKKQMFSSRDDVTVANPLGPPIRGWNGIAKALEGAAARFRDGEPHSFERISEYGTPDLAYVLEIERTRAKIGASDELASFALRTTTVWRREVEGWKIAHRHADPITTPRPLESILER